jgi:hypothetical protein
MSNLIAVSLMHGQLMGRGATAEEAIAAATLNGRDGSADFLDVYDCGADADALWRAATGGARPPTLHELGARYQRVHHGTAYDRPES